MKESNQTMVPFKFPNNTLIQVDHKFIKKNKGFYKDGEAAVNYLLSRADIDTSKIIVFGQSIGGAVVIDLALKFNEKLFAVIVEVINTCFDRINTNINMLICVLRILLQACPR